jgi:hypothetical protein
MRPTFALNLDLQPVSVNAPKTTPHAFTVGDVLSLSADYPYEFGLVPMGTKFFVSHVDDEDGTMWLLAEGDVPALWHADNMLVASPYDTEDFLPYLRAAIRCPAVTNLVPEQEPKTNVRQLSKLALVACLLWAGFSVGQRVHTPHQIFNHSPGIQMSDGATQDDIG